MFVACYSCYSTRYPAPAPAPSPSHRPRSQFRSPLFVHRSLGPSLDRSLGSSPRHHTSLLCSLRRDNSTRTIFHAWAATFFRRVHAYFPADDSANRAVDFVRHACPPTRLWTHATSKSIAEWITLRGPIRSYYMPDPPVSRIGRRGGGMQWKEEDRRGGGREEKRKERERERGWAST